MSTPGKGVPAAAKAKAAKAGAAKPAARRTTPARPGGPAAGKAGGKAGGARPPAPPGPDLVVGTVPPLARVAGGVAVVAAVLLLLAPAFPLARSGGADLGGPGNLWAFVPPLPLAAVVAAAGVLAVRGALPRLGLAVLFPVGTLAAGLLLRALHLQQTGARSTLDLPLGLGGSARYETGPGLLVTTAAYGLLVVAAVLASTAWPRTIMEDGGDLDPRRPRLAAWGLAVGVLSALVLGMAPYASRIAPGAPTLPERDGLDLLGALVVALGAAAWAVFAATLRPRLAVVGAYAGLAAALLTEGLSIGLLVARSDQLGRSAGGVGILLAAAAVLALALASARAGRLKVGR